ncbi:MAG: Ig-like domain-containing protein, partial [Desulfobulbales bacterium]
EQYEAAGTFSDGSSQDVTILTTWESSDMNVATIDNAGLATTLASGSTTITGAWQGIESNASLLVTDATLTAVTITPETATIAQGTTVQFEAEGTFSDDTPRDITDIVDWQSTDDGIGIVYTDGLAEGIAPGQADISASYDVGGNTISATAALTVTNAVIESIIVTPENSTIQVGENQQYSATGTFSDGSEQDITELATWLTTNNSVGTISNSSDSRGLFSSIASGATDIKASFGGISGETLLTVVE